MIYLKIIVSNKGNHPVYSNIFASSNNNYKFISDSQGKADFTIYGIDENPDASFWKRVNDESNSGMKYFFYAEPTYYFDWIPKDLINHTNFCGFISHVKSTADDAGLRYGVPSFYLPIGVRNISDEIINKKFEKLMTKKNTFLFWNSWMVDNFYNRGGNYVDEIFCNVKKHFDINMIAKTNINLKSENLYKQDIRRIRPDEYIAENDMNQIFSESDLFLLPSVQAHWSSIPFAMSYGLPCIVNYNWGYCHPDQLVIDEYNGLKYKTNNIFVTAPYNFFNKNKKYKIISNFNRKFKSVQSIESPNILGEKQILFHIVDHEYIKNISDKICSILENKEKLFLLSQNALNTQKQHHNISNYERNIMAILENF